MAVNVKSMNGLAAIKKAGVPDDLVEWLVGSSYEVKLTATAFQFVPEGSNVPKKVVPVSLSLLQKLSSGAITATEKEKLTDDLVVAVMALKGSEPKKKGALSMLPPDVVAGVVQQKVEATATAMKQVGEAAKQAALAWEVFDLKLLQSSPAVKLRDATKMYQPVYGTSNGSRYFVVGGNDDIRVAAKYKGGSLSIRVEGPNWEKHLSNIQNVGFGKADVSAGYASLHLSVSDDLVAAKALGAVLLGLGVQLDTPLPNVKLIKGLG